MRTSASANPNASSVSGWIVAAGGCPVTTLKFVTYFICLVDYMALFFCQFSVCHLEEPESVVNRKNAFLIHLGLSALVVGTVIVLVMLFWYPAPWMQVIGAANVLGILVAVDLIVGPCLTLLLYKPGKPGLVFDLCMIGLVQLVALGYGIHTVYQERPYYVVFVKDRFEVLAYKDVAAQDIKDEALRRKDWRQPVMAIASMPTDAVARNRVLEETLFEGKPDIHARPEFWSPYAGNTAEVLAGAKSINELLHWRPELVDELDADMATDKFVYAPVMGRKQVFSLILDKSTGQPVRLVDIDPWTAARTDKRLAHN